MELIKPERLKRGDIIALISPSTGLVNLFPHRLDNAIKFLNNFGFKIKEYPTTRTSIGWSSGTDKDRARDVMDAFEDNSVKAIICTIGGMTSNQLLKNINFDIIKDNPKIFCGYSDISVLHHAIHKKTNMVTFYGPMAMTQFGEYPKPLDYTLDYFLKAVENNTPIGKIIPSKDWTEELLDWSTKTDMKRPRKLQKNLGFEWLCDGKCKGSIIGGCTSSIIKLRGTEFWPDYKDRILFLETPEGQTIGKGEPLNYLDSYLTDLELSGVFDEISGLVFGRPYCYSSDDNIKLKEILRKFGIEYSIPVLFGVDIGHTDPIITIPIGTNAILDSTKNIFSLDESGVK